jgi:NAD(P)-dependent dehydrogenase (short-subunit alcohol dehydrogenase family)
MDLELDGKRAVVTGAGKGIGLAIARRLAQEGADVVAVARTSAPDERGIKPVLLDLTAPESAAALADVVGEADILVNNLGGVVPASATAQSFLDVDDATWQSTFELNFFSTVRITRALLPGLLRRSGVIVNVSSIGARASFRPVDYGTAKAALNNFTKALAEEFGSQGLRAVTVSPGPTRTPIWTDPQGPAGLLAQASGVSIEEILAGLPAAMGITTGRLTEPEETAALIAFVVSARGGNLTGADFVADGGALKAV